MSSILEFDEAGQGLRIGLIAGSGQFPILFAQAAKLQGVRVVAVGFEGETDPALAGYVDEFHMLRLGQLSRLIEAFQKAGVSRAAMAGGINKTRLYTRLRPDWRAIKLVHRLRKRNDDFLLRAIADELETEGIRIEQSTLFLPSLLVPEGVLTRRKPNHQEMLDIEYGWRMAKSFGKLDIGQCIVVKDKSVLAVEGMDGTDATITRGGGLCGKGAIVVKVCKPIQDDRFDIPAVGLATIETMRKVNASVLVFEAGKSLVFDRDKMIDAANAARISIIARKDAEADAGGGDEGSGSGEPAVPAPERERPGAAPRPPGWASSPVLIREPEPGSLKVGVIGTGYLGRFHAQKYAGLRDASLVAVVDTDEERAKTIAQTCKTESLKDYRELFGRVDAVSIVTPTFNHYAIAKDFLAEGVHVLLEKPMTRTLEEADHLIALAREKGCVLQIGHLERFNPAFMSLAPHLRNPIFIETHRLALFNKRGLEVDVILDLMIHDIDAALHIVKSPLRHIRVAGIPVLTKLPDIANVRLEFANGALANLTASRISIKSMRKLRVFQENCYLVADYNAKRAFCFWKEDMADDSGFPQIATEELQVEGRDALEEEIISFLEAVRTGGRAVVDGEQGRAALAVALEVSRQIEEQIRANGIK